MKINPYYLFYNQCNVSETYREEKMERREEVGVTVYTHNAMVMAVAAKRYIFIEAGLCGTDALMPSNLNVKIQMQMG
jgi:hypothetical protein